MRSSSWPSLDDKHLRAHPSIAHSLMAYATRHFIAHSEPGQGTRRLLLTRCASGKLGQPMKTGGARDKLG